MNEGKKNSVCVIKPTLNHYSFANGPGDQGSVPGRVIPKTQKWYLMPPCLTLSFIRYKPRVMWINSGKEVAPLPMTRCSSYWKESLRVTLVLHYNRSGSISTVHFFSSKSSRRLFSTFWFFVLSYLFFFVDVEWLQFSNFMSRFDFYLLVTFNHYSLRPKQEIRWCFRPLTLRFPH